MGNDRNAIIGTGVDVDRFHFLPEIIEVDDTNDASRLLGYMRESGVDTILGRDYAPIGFAAHDRGKRGAVYKAAGDAIYKDVNQTVHVTKRFDLD